MPRSPQPRNPSRTPAQARGERRVESILAAAAAVMADVGYEKLTLRAVADRSGSAIGSLYHFFPDKDALIDALVERVAAGIRALLPQTLPSDPADEPVEQFVHALFDPIARFVAAHPELPALIGRVHANGSGLDEEIAARLDRIIRLRAPAMRGQRRAVVVRMTMAIVRGGIGLLATAPPRVRTDVQTETEAALAAYLGATLPRHG